MNYMKTPNPEILICDCSSTEHQIVFWHDEEDNFVYCHIHMAGRSFWKRIVPALRYIFGYRCKFGHWEEFILSRHHTDQLQQLVDMLKRK